MLKLNKIISKFLLSLARYCYRNNYLNLKSYYFIALEKHFNIKKVNYPRILIDVLILAEDRKFFSHIGIDIFAIIRAIYFNIVGKQQGASTIPQQYIRVLTSYYQWSIKRKITEIFLALLLNDIFSKKDIANNYLNIAYFGHNMYGIDKAMSKMKISVNNITIEQAASLIARLKYPQPETENDYKNVLIKKRTMHLTKIYMASIQKQKKWYNQPIKPTAYSHSAFYKF